MDIDADKAKEGGSYLSVVSSARGEEGLQGVVAGKEETGKVDKEFASNIEEDQEEVDTDETQDHVDLGDGSLALQVVQDRVLG